MSSVLLPNSFVFTDIPQAISRLTKGEIIGIPTETVYGLAGLGYSVPAINEIYRLKNRPHNNPLIIHYACIEDTVQDVIWSPWAQHLANHFWPGPLTFVLSLSPNTRIPLAATGGLNSAAIRVPAHPMVQEILHNLDAPLAAPSANLSGKLSPTTADHVTSALDVPVLDGGACVYGLESTILDCRSYPVKILRPGALTIEQIVGVLQDSHYAYAAIPGTQPNDLTNSEHCLEHIVCPGQMMAHYAPKKPIRLNATRVEPHEGLLAFGPALVGAKYYVQLSLEKNLNQAAASLFSGLHFLDLVDCESIAVMPIPKHGIGEAIHDRLSRACAAFPGK
jgi:L-threonylcarbamoyladenylate synthase